MENTENQTNTNIEGSESEKSAGAGEITLEQLRTHQKIILNVKATSIAYVIKL